MDKILVIDDSAVQAEFIKNMLQDDYDVTVCQTAEKGLQCARTGVYSLILLDVIMPGMSGFTLLKELQETALTRHFPVILITSLDDTENEERGLILGAVDYITKPFNPVIVKARVNTHIRLFNYQMRYREQAMLDELTGVANRRSYENNSLMKWQEAIRFEVSFSVCMIDVDKFKVYNDTFGHPAGDKVLTAVAKVVSSYLKRATDFFARYGGEEFVAIFLNNSPKGAYEFMKRIRQAVENLHIPHNPSVSEWVTISVGGYTLFPREGDSYEDCLKIADNMLYEAKGTGRNMVVWSNEKKEKWREK
ncbi:MAG TPA: diguanylate cyclase response regulator [Lachnospiraceae bacterium]|nr:diguanylate cyclase response regulator [Lachnospiraceae bacterium]